ncbi:hypothetical protein RZS08_10710, partial [Arthrospira platensis SPKY1]|nr:hypothetical protein [Arthrospira platensis SPKY1]
MNAPGRFVGAASGPGVQPRAQHAVVRLQGAQVGLEAVEADALPDQVFSEAVQALGSGRWAGGFVSDACIDATVAGAGGLCHPLAPEVRRLHVGHVVGAAVQAQLGGPQAAQGSPDGRHAGGDGKAH